MNDVILEIASYLEKLPPPVREVVSRANWEPKVAEIGKKYSLTESQVSDIGFEVLFVLVGMEPEEDLSENIKAELGVSDVLSDQIAEEIQNRILAPLAKSIDQLEQPSQENTQHTNTLDVPPPNLPSEEIIEEPLTEPKEVVFAPVVTPAHSILQEQATASTAPLYKETQPQTYSFKASPKVETDPQPTAPQIPKPASFIETKLTQPVKPNNPPFIPPQSYVSDPYREPLE